METPKSESIAFVINVDAVAGMTTHFCKNQSGINEQTVPDRHCITPASRNAFKARCGRTPNGEKAVYA